MTEGKGFGLERFLIRLVAVTVAAIVVLYLAKVWLVDELHSPRVTLQSQTAKQEDSLSATAEGKVKAALISWRNAGRYYGEYATVEGKIVATYNSGNACFLNFDKDHRRYFTAVIFASDFGLFPANPEDFYQGKEVRITGLIKEYKGKPEIVLDDPSQIEVLR